MDSISKYFWTLSAVLLAIIIFSPFKWWAKLLIIIILYLFIVFALSRMMVTAFGFRKMRLPATLSKELQQAVESIQGTTEQRLEKAYLLVTERFYGESGKTFARLGELFWSSPAKEWRKGGYANCTKMNYFLRVLLVKSGTVEEEQISLKVVNYRYNIHQYLQVETENGSIVLDPAFHYASIPFARKNDGWWHKHFKPERYDGLYLKD